MNRFDFDTPVDRRGTSSAKWDRYKNSDVLPMWVADMDFASPPAVCAALHQRVDHGVFGYTGVPEELVDCVVALLNTRYGWRIQSEWLVWLPGLVTGLNVACRAAAAVDEEVMTATPVYPPFLSAPSHFHRRLRRVPLAEDRGRWALDIDRTADALTPETRLFLLCNPHNPVGRMFTRAELERLADICLENGMVICSDEIHCDLVLDENRRHIPTATLAPEIERRTITLMAPSKTFNVPGLGCAFAVVPDAALRRRFVSAMAGIVPHVNTLGFTAALAAFQQGWPWLEALLGYLRKNRDLVADRIEQMHGLRASPVEATYLAWIDARSLQIDDPAGFFERAGVGLSDGREFGAPGFVRLNFGCPRQRLAEALDRMAAATER